MCNITCVWNVMFFFGVSIKYICTWGSIVNLSYEMWYLIFNCWLPYFRFAVWSKYIRFVGWFVWFNWHFGVYASSCFQENLGSPIQFFFLLKNIQIQIQHDSSVRNLSKFVISCRILPNILTVQHKHLLFLHFLWTKKKQQHKWKCCSRCFN